MRAHKKLLLGALATLWGCSAIDKGIRHGSLDVQTQMSRTLFLDPAPDARHKTLYLEVRNTSDRQQIRVKDAIVDAFSARGYNVVARPNQAAYVVQINLLNVKRVQEPRQAWDALAHGGSVGAVTGASAAYIVAPDSGRGMVGAGLIAGAVGSLIDSAVEVIHYTMVTDIRITQQAPLHQKSFETRIVSLANKVNLEFDEAIPSLRKGLIDSLTGLFE